MELLIGTLAVFGLLAILIRFLPRDAAGRVQLPRIVDESIGMWLVRRAFAWRSAQQPRPAQPGPPPVWLPGEPRVRLPGQPSVAPPSRAIQRRPSEAYRRGTVRVAQGLLAVAALTTVLVIGFVVAGVALRPTAAPDGEVLAATGTPGPSPRSTSTLVTADTTAPTGAIVGLSKKPIGGSALLRVTVTWTLTDSGSGIKSQVLQRRIDSGPWETVALPSSTTRSVSQRLPRGHKYTFRVRGVDHAGNIGAFASRYLYI